MQSILKILACLATTAAKTQIPIDNSLQQALEGAWCNSIDEGKTCWGFDVFAKGQTKSCGRLPETEHVFEGVTSYRVNGNLVCHVVTASNLPEFLSAGDKRCFEVLGIDSNRQIFRDLVTQEIDILYKVQTSDVNCPKPNH